MISVARVLIASLLLVSACSAGDAGQQAPSSESGEPSRKVNVGIATDMPGLGVASGYKYSGFDVDLYQWLGQHAEPSFVPVAVPMPVSDRVNALVDGRVDLVVEAFSITDARREEVDFAGPYLVTKQGVMVRTGDTSIQTLAQLEGRTVCTLAGSTSLQQVVEGALKKKVTLIEETGLQQCADRLRSGLADAVSTDQLILHGMAQQDPAHLSVVPNLTLGSDESYGIGLPNGSRQLCEAFTAKIKEFIVDGYWNNFFAQHFGDLPHPEQYQPSVDRLDRCE